MRAPKPRFALLLIDFFHPDAYRGLGPVGAGTLRAAMKTAALRSRARMRRIPIIYVNDNFGDWATDFRTLVTNCAAQRNVAGRVSTLLQPAANEAFVLKPRHSAFYGTPLEFLLEELRCNTVILTGITADSCITMTAHDAHVRQFSVRVPADCVAGASAAVVRTSMAQLRRVVDADTRRSEVILNGDP